LAADIDETPLAGEGPEALVERLARAKAAVVAGRAARDRVVLAADTIVLLEGRILGKPRDTADAHDMLRQLSGRTHEVLTGVCVARADRTLSGIERTEVRLAALRDPEIAAYVATGEPMDKAGAYHIDGRAAAFVTGIVGSPSNVAGLPMALAIRLLREAGLPGLG
jgi:septum formation protein